MSSRIEMTPRGVQETKYGACLLRARLPVLNGCRPSTSLSGPIMLIIFSSSRCGGNGSWTRTPLTSESCWSWRTFCIKSSSEDVAGSLKPLFPIPICSHAFSLSLTYSSDCGRSPTIMWPRTGRLRACWGLAFCLVMILYWRASLIRFAKLLPSKTLSLY